MGATRERPEERRSRTAPHVSIARGRVMDRENMRSFLSREKAPIYLILAAVALLALGILVTAPRTFGPYRLSDVAFPNTQSAGRERISGLLYVPGPAAPGNRAPAVVFAHGTAANKELYLPFCAELARRGIVVLAIDLPGHGQSQGHCDLGRSEYTALLSSYDWLVSNVGVVDPAKVVAAGHSLGGVSCTMAGLHDDRGRFAGVAAIYCWSGLDETLNLVYGKVDELSGVWPFTIWSRDFRLKDAKAFQERDITSLLSVTKPVNYLLVAGTYDELCTPEQNRLLISAATGGAPVKTDVLAGSFKNGTARMLLLTGDEHLTEPVSPTVFEGVYNWVRQIGGTPEENTHPSLLFRYPGWLLLLTGCLFGAAAASAAVFKEASRKVGGGAGLFENIASPSAPLAAAGCALFLAVSLVALPLADLLRLRLLVPFAAGDIASSIAVVRAPLLLVMILLMAAIVTRGPERSLDIDWKAQGRRQASALASALAGFALFVAIYAPLARWLHLGPGLPYSWSAFLLFAGLFAAELWVTGKFFHVFVLPAFERRAPGEGRGGYLLTEATMRAVGQAIVLVPVMSGALLVIGKPGSLRVPVLLGAFLLSWPAFLVLAWLNIKARDNAGSLLAPSLFAALLLSWTLTALVSVR